MCLCKRLIHSFRSVSLLCQRQNATHNRHDRFQALIQWIDCYVLVFDARLLQSYSTDWEAMSHGFTCMRGSMDIIFRCCQDAFGHSTASRWTLCVLVHLLMMGPWFSRGDAQCDAMALITANVLLLCILVCIRVRAIPPNYELHRTYKRYWNFKYSLFLSRLEYSF